MASFFSAKRIRDAISSVGTSRAKSAFLDFLIIKRTFKLKDDAREPGAKGTPLAVAIAQSEPKYIEALEQFALCNTPKAPNPYINVFAVTDNKTGYRSPKFPSNSANSTIDGNPWRSVFDLDTSVDPRRASFVAGYEDHLETLVLKGPPTAEKPKIDDAAIWFYRAQDIDGIVAGATTPAEKLGKVRERFIADLALTDKELPHLFEIKASTIIEADFVPVKASPDDYLPNISTGLASTPASITGGCSLDLVTALTAKPFVILTGPSGTGKSRAALKMAEGLQRAVGTKIDGTLFELIPVGPDWTSPKRLTGFKTPFGETRKRDDGSETNNSYDITATLRLILRAQHPDATGIPHFLIFDEMNLSHVERYFADFLSLMEASNSADEDETAQLLDLINLKVIDEVLQQENPKSLEAASAHSLVLNNQPLRLPSNLFFIGTINVDETTYMFSPKVLDRAHVLEIETQRPSSYLKGSGVEEPGGLIDFTKAADLLKSGIDDREGQLHEVPNSATILDRLVKEAGFKESEIETIRSGVISALDGCYELLSPVGFPFGYRAVKEVFVYVYVWIKSRHLLGLDKAAILEQWPQALDKAILQKILPKLHGSKRVLGDSLKATAAYLGGGHSSSTPPARYTLNLGVAVEIRPEAALALPGGAKLEHSIRKLESMHGRLLSTGYASSVS